VIYTLSRGGWWWVTASLLPFTLTVGLFGTIDGSWRTERDARGNTVSSRRKKQAADG